MLRATAGLGRADCKALASRSCYRSGECTSNASFRPAGTKLLPCSFVHFVLCWAGPNCGFVVWMSGYGEYVIVAG